MKRILRYTVFPLVFLATMSLAMAGIQAGYETFYLVTFLNVAVALVILLLERVMPFTSEWNRERDDVVTDLTHVFLSTLIAPELIKLFLPALMFQLGSMLSAWLGMSLWPGGLPLLLQLLLALVVAEFGQYWIHRLAHEHEWLWRLHATHHGAERLYWLNAGRFHPFDAMLQYGFMMSPLLLLGIPDDVLALFLLFTAVHGLFQHANLDIRLGPLNWFFSMAELHRWHHSTLAREGNTNYGANIILWDIVFGTRFLPADRQPPVQIGIGDMPYFPKRYQLLRLQPLQYRNSQKRWEE